MNSTSMTYVTKELVRMGLFPQQQGLVYLSFAINKVANDMIGYYSGKLAIYNELTNYFETAIPQLSAGMCHSIECAWNMPYSGELKRLFSTKRYPPAAMEFICRMAIEFVRRRQETRSA